MLPNTHWLYTTPIAHRGLHDAALPENSLPAIEAAIAHGYAIEIDIRLTADGEIVVFHDHNLPRMTGKQGDIRDFTLDELTTITLLDTDHTIPSLAETLALVNAQVPLLIEIKNEYDIGPIESKLCDMLENYSGDYVVQSFNRGSLIWLKQHQPHIIRGQLYPDFRVWDMPKKQLRRYVKRFLNKESAPHAVAFSHGMLPNKYLSKLCRKGVCVLGWTARNNDDVDKIRRYCDNVIFDYVRP